MGRKTDEYDITEEEAQFLRSSRVQPEVRAFMARNYEGVGVQIRAYQKVGAVARAEAEALRAIRDRSNLLGDLADVSEARAEAEIERRKRNAIEVQLTETQRKLELATAEPAMVVHANGSQR